MSTEVMRTGSRLRGTATVALAAVAAVMVWAVGRAVLGHAPTVGDGTQVGVVRVGSLAALAALAALHVVVATVLVLGLGRPGR